MKKELLLLTGWLFIITGAVAQNPSCIGAVVGNGGRPEVFVARPGSHGGVYHSYLLTGSENWQKPWMIYLPAPDDLPHGLVTGKDGEGRIITAWISNGNIYTAAARAKDVGLTTAPTPDFAPIAGAHFNFISIANNRSGLVVLTALDDKGRCYVYEEVKQADPIAISWQWTRSQAGGHDLQNVSAAPLGTSTQMMLAATGGDNLIYLAKKNNNGGWDWANLGSEKFKEIHAHPSIAQQLELIGLGVDGKIYLNFQNVGTGNMSGWGLPIVRDISGMGKISFGPNLYFNHFKDGTLFIVFHSRTFDQDSRMGISSQFPGNAGWPATFKLFTGPKSPTAPENVTGFDGKLSAIAMAPDGILHIFGFMGNSKVAHFSWDGKTTDAFGRAVLSTDNGNKFGRVPLLPW